MRWTFLIIVLFGLVSCLKNQSRNPGILEAENRISQEWLYAYQIENIKFNGEVILRPPGISQLLFSLSLPELGGAYLKTHCVYYQVPYKKISGVLRIEELKKRKDCPLESLGESWIEITQVKDLSVKFENFKLSFQFIQNSKKINWSFLLPNVEERLIHEKYQAPKERKLYSGMSFLRLNEESLGNQNNRYLGKLSDRFSKGSSIRCHQVDKNCQDLGANRCDDCAYGWYQVVDYNCPQGGSKFCGQNHCGEKNEPACPRGTKVVGREESGICQNDLTASWNSDHVLVCL